MPRKYELKERADGVAQTRARIVEATVGLHEEVGPARTTVTAIADRAGVQRLTVYRHFPDEHALIRACSAHWTAQHPRPDPGAWALVADPEERLRTALGELYAFFRETEGMTGNILRDLPHSPVLREVAAPFVRYWEEARGVLGRGWAAKRGRRTQLEAAIGHATDFETWRSLTVKEGLAEDTAVELMVRLARVAAS